MKTSIILLLCLLYISKGISSTEFEFLPDESLDYLPILSDEIPLVSNFSSLSKTQSSVVSASEAWDLFKHSTDRRFISVKEESFRRVIFQRKLQQIEEHNRRYRQGLETYEMGINQFSDYTEDEFSFYANGLQSFAFQPKPQLTFSDNSSFARIIPPASFDWRSKGGVTPVKNQQKCGSCWAFAVVAAIESHYKIRFKRTVTLSEQQLVDCAKQAWGCNGGTLPIAYSYIRRNGGINYDSVYPYKGSKGSCSYNILKPKVKIRGFGKLIVPNEYLLKVLLVTKGPISVGIDASGNFGSYSKGVYYNPKCSAVRRNHAVLVVGYGKENGHDYWLVKNSWGPNWGENGYIKMARNRNNNCGIASDAEYPIL